MPKKVTPEGAVTKAIRDVLKLSGILHWKQHQGLGSTPGVSDIIGLMPDGTFLAIEVKAPGKRVKPGSAQARFLENIHMNRGIAIEADSVEAVVRQLRDRKYKLPVLFKGGANGQ